MIITCEQCSTRFTLDDSLIQPQGSKVRCSQCKHVFTAFPEAPDTGSEDFDAPVDFDISEPDAPPEDETSFDAPESSETLEMEFSGEDEFEFESGDFDDQELDFGEVEFDDAPDFEDTDFQEPAFEDAAEEDLDTDLELDIPEEDIPEEDIPEEMNASDSSQDLELEFPDELEVSEPSEDSEEPAPALQGVAPPLEEEDLELDLELEPLDMEIEDIEPIEGEVSDAFALAESDTAPADMEISFDGDEDLVLVESPTMDSDAAPRENLEDIEFDTDDFDDGLELVLEDDPDADLVFEEPGGIEDLAEPGEAGDGLELANGFEAAPRSLDEQEFEPELDLEEEPDFFIEDELPDLHEEGARDDAQEEKFAEYDAVLDQEPGTEEVIPDPELEEELADVEGIAPPVPSGAQEQDEMLIGGPALAGDGRKTAKKRGGIGAPVKIFFLLFILVIAAYIASLKLGADIPFLSQINIPYVTDALKPAPKPVQHLKPVPNEPSINGRFLSNATAGELFVITGRVDNPAQIAYSNIQVKGNLLDKAKAKVGTQTAFCGNIIPEETLKNGNISDIANQLKNKNGLQNSNVNVGPGKSVPFMLVFSNLPENLTNFTVEVAYFKEPAKKD